MAASFPNRSKEIGALGSLLLLDRHKFETIYREGYMVRRLGERSLRLTAIPSMERPPILQFFAGKDHMDRVTGLLKAQDVPFRASRYGLFSRNFRGATHIEKGEDIVQEILPPINRQIHQTATYKTDSGAV